MSKKNNLTEIWNVYADSIIKEAKTSRPIDGGYKKMSTKPGPGAVELDSKEAKKIQHTGNEGTTEPVYEIEGVHEPVDPKKKKGDKENLYEPEKYSSEKFDEKVEKTYREGININMKSVFDKLFEDVMGDESIEELDALGIDAEETDAEETDEITLTLDRDMAQQLCDLIQAQLGEEEDDDAGEEDYEGEEGFNSFDEAEEDEDEDETVDEATEMKEVPSSAGHKLTSRQNKVGSVKASGGKAHGQVKSTVDGKGKPLADGKGKLTSKNNKVGGTKTGSTGGSFFA